jgi:hypothetical protein
MEHTGIGGYRDGTSDGYTGRTTGCRYRIPLAVGRRNGGIVAPHCAICTKERAKLCATCQLTEMGCLWYNGNRKGWDIPPYQIEKETIEMSEQVLARMRGMVVGSLRYYAEQCECDGECEQAEILVGIADRISNGTATDEDWLEALDQLDVSDI